MIPGVRKTTPQPPSTGTAQTQQPAPSQVGKAGGSAGDTSTSTSTFDPTPTPPPPVTATPTPEPEPTPTPTQTTTPGPTPTPTTTPGPTTTPTPDPVPTPPAPAPWSFSSTINADRAKSTRDALTKYAAGDEKAAARLTPTIVDALVNGVGTPKTQSILGQEGVLGRRQAMDAARALTGMPQAAYDQLSTLLDQAGKGPDGTVPQGASADTERALILKAAAARTAPLGDANTQEQAMGELQWFANTIRGQTRDGVIQQTSVVDVDDQANTSTANPLDSTVTNDQKADNDGYAQRFTTSCAPAVAAMVRGEADPVFALMLNADGLQNNNPNADASNLERAVLEKDRFFNASSPDVALTPEQLDAFKKDGTLPPGVEHLAGAAVSRVGQQARKVMDEQLDGAVAAGTITKDQAEALRKDAQGGTLTDAEKTDRDAALNAVRNAGGNHPTDFEIQAMRGDKPRESFMLIAHALRDLASGATNTDYWDFNAGKSMDGPMLDKMEKVLTSGVDLPARLSTPGQDGGHFIMFTDVRNQEGQREFLASDPWSGRSTWLKESDLVNPKSDWPRREFNVFWQQVTDVFAPIDFIKPDGQ